jgi:hypothetical protein
MDIFYFNFYGYKLILLDNKEVKSFSLIYSGLFTADLNK